MGFAMSLSESYGCDVCGTKKTDSEQWWLMWMECVPATAGMPDQPLLKLSRWETAQAHAANVRHLCGARCAGTSMDRWMAEQHENPKAHCAP